MKSHLCYYDRIVCCPCTGNRHKIFADKPQVLMRKPCSNSDLARKNVPHSESFAVHALICKTLTNQGFADKKNSAFQQNCSKNGVPSLGAGDEESAEAPPAADEARRFRGSAPAVGRDSGRESAGTTVGRHGPRPTECLTIECLVGQGPCALPRRNGMVPRTPPNPLPIKGDAIWQK